MAGMWSAKRVHKSNKALTPPPTRVATVKRAPAEERASATKAMDSTTSSNWRRSGNADVLLTELFRKAMDTSNSSATKVRRSERKSGAEGPNLGKALAPDITRTVNQVEKIVEGDSPHVRLLAPATPPRKTNKSRAVRTEEDHTMYQRHKSPHLRVNDSNHSATMHTPPLYLASPQNRRLNPHTSPSPSMTQSLGSSGHICHCHLERLPAGVCDLPSDTRRLNVSPHKQAQVLQPIGPWQASDEKAFHRRGAMNPGTSTNQPSDLPHTIQAMSLGVFPRTDTSTLGIGCQYARGNVIEQSYNGFNRMQQRPGPMMTDATVLQNDFAHLLPSGLRSPRGGGVFGSLDQRRARFR